jgi:drug/metabolite transporter (DMT)-like permease
MRAPSPSLLTVGVELGSWNLAAAALHAAGLQRTSATEAAFVVCATGILTPVYAAVAGEKQGQRVWTGCGVALLGALALSLDKSGVLSGGAAAAAGSPSPSSSSLAGDGFVLCAAAFYSAATFRLSVLAPVHASGASGSASSPQALAAAKSAAFAAGAVLWAAASGDLFLGAGHGGPASLLPSAPAAAAAGAAAAATAAAAGGEPPLSFAAPLVLAWAALGPGALAAVLQSGAQARVAAGRAQALFATVPLWSAALAGVALGERTGAAGWAGGLLIVAGGALAATAPRES